MYYVYILMNFLREGLLVPFLPQKGGGYDNKIFRCEAPKASF